MDDSATVKPVPARLPGAAHGNPDLPSTISLKWASTIAEIRTRRCNVLLVDAFEADGASWEQVEKFFTSRNIQIARVEDVLLTPIPEAVRALPIPELDRVEMLRLAATELDKHIAKLAATPAPKSRFN